MAAGGTALTVAVNVTFAPACEGFSDETNSVTDPDAAVVTVTYYPEGGGAITREPFTVKANSRSTVMVNAHAGAGIPTSARVSSTQPVIVERPMYFSYGPAGWTGGHDVLGYAVNAQD